MVNANRLAAMQRIRALLAKTVDNGCTESEALAAAVKVGELMDRYGITYSDLELKSERCRKHTATDRYHDVNLVSAAIGRFCSCDAWFNGGGITYFGFTIDVLIANYLTSLCRSAMEVEFERFFQSNARPRDQKKRFLRKPFMVAMADRLSERFDEMLSSREATATTANGTSLVVVKKAIVEEQLKALGMKFTSTRAPRYRDNAAARTAGQAAGDRVNLVPGVPVAPARKLLS